MLFKWVEGVFVFRCRIFEGAWASTKRPVIPFGAKIVRKTKISPKEDDLILIRVYLQLFACCFTGANIMPATLRNLASPVRGSRLIEKYILWLDILVAGCVMDKGQTPAKTPKGPK